MLKRIYEDDNWVIEVLSNTGFNPIIRVSSFKDGHFIDDIELSRQTMESEEFDEVKCILYK